MSPGTLLECRQGTWNALWNKPNEGLRSGAEVIADQFHTDVPTAMFLGETRITSTGSSEWLFVMTAKGVGWMRASCFHLDE